MHLKCSSCDRTFSKTEHLRRHERSHTKEKPFTCPKCGRSYARSDVLARHMRMHLRKGEGRAETHSSERPHTSDSESVGAPGGRLLAKFLPEEGMEPVDVQRLRGPSTPDWSAEGSRPGSQARPISASTGLDGHYRSSGLVNSASDFNHITSANSSLNASLATPTPHRNLISLYGHTGLVDADVNGSNRLDRQQRTDHLDRTRAQGDVPTHHDQVLRLFHNMPFAPSHSTSTVGPPSSMYLSTPALANNEFNSSAGVLGENHPDQSSNDLQRWLRVTQQNTPVNAILQLAGNLDPARTGTGLAPRSGTATPYGTLSLPSGFGHFPKVEQNWYNRIGHQTGGHMKVKSWYDIARGMTGDLFNCSGQQTPLNRHMRHEDIDDICRLQLIRAVYPEVTNPFDPAATCSLQDYQAAVSRFPDSDMFTTAVHRYFDSFDREAPFLHHPVFSIKTCSSLMLFVMSCIGFVLCGTDDGLFFVHSNFDALRSRIVSELDRKLTSTTKDSLPTFATAFMFLKLAALISDRDHLSPCQLLYSSLLTLAQLHGVFSGCDDAGIDDLYQSFASLEERWHAWGRIESFKRVAISLMRLDSAYCTFLRAPPTIRVAKLRFHMPCDDALFGAPSADAWWQLQQQSLLPVTLPAMGTAASLDRLAEIGPLSYYALHSVLNYLQLRNADAYQRLMEDPANIRPDGDCVLVPLQLYRENLTLQDFVRQVVTFMHVWPRVAPHYLHDWQRSNLVVFWHYLCLCLTVPQDLVEVAAGRDGVPAASQAINSIAAWSQTSAARRALVHAAHVYKLLSQRQQHEMSSIYVSFATFISALVITLYVFARPSIATDSPGLPYELTQDVDWSSFGMAGLDDPMKPADHSQAEQFILEGGDWTFDGRSLHGLVGGRHVLARFADLLRTCGRYNFRQMSQILVMMNDMLQQNVQDV